MDQKIDRQDPHYYSLTFSSPKSVGEIWYSHFAYSLTSSARSITLPDNSALAFEKEAANKNNTPSNYDSLQVFNEAIQLLNRTADSRTLVPSYDAVVSRVSVLPAQCLFNGARMIAGKGSLTAGEFLCIKWNSFFVKIVFELNGFFARSSCILFEIYVQ